jgi:MFS family permease
VRRLPTWYGWIIVAVVAVILMSTAGARFLFGVVLKPIAEDFDWGRSDLTAAVLINMVVLSVCQPLVGWIVDRVGPSRVLVVGASLVGLVLIPLSFVTQLWQVYLLYGFVGGIAFAATSPVNITALVSRWFTRHRSAALSLATSGTPLGQLIIVPAAAWTLTVTDWQTTYRLLALMLLLVMAPLGLFFLRDRPTEPPAPLTAREGRAAPRDMSESLRPREAFVSPVFWLLAFGFIACGFTMAFANTHFMAYADDIGMRPVHAANVISVIAVFSVAGSLALGWMADRTDRASVLGVTYALRGIAYFLLFLLPEGRLVFGYAIVLGISWSATTPLTAALAADSFGPANIGLIFGAMFTFMNLGAGTGAFFDAVIYDVAGNYNVALLINGFAGIAAASASFIAGAIIRSGERRITGERAMRSPTNHPIATSGD